ncbi:MAG: hypothetical protein P8078_08390 [bacterium]
MKGDKHTSLINLTINSILLIFFLNCLLWCGCEKLITGYGPQPSYIDRPEYEQKLNILGILRPDSLQDRPQSFVHVEKAISIYDADDSLSIHDVGVCIIELDDKVPIDSVHLVYSDFNGFYSEKEYRNDNFFPRANTTYEVRCTKEGFPELGGRTTVPLKPEIREESIHFFNNNLFFTIRSDTLASLYYIFLEVEESVFFKQYLKKKDEKVNIEFELQGKKNVHTARVTIIAYDNKFSEYVSYNVNIKPNTYREDYSTVKNGFGCFGSLNITEQDIYF